MNFSNLGVAILLTVLAGLSTGIGGLIVLLFEKTNTKLLSIALGFSAGVMIYVSFVELLFESRRLLIANLGAEAGVWVNVIAFFGGMLLIAIIDKLVPSYENPHETHMLEESASCPVDGSQILLRTGIFTAVIIAIHNFP